MPVGVRATKAYPAKIMYIEDTIATIFFLNPFITDINNPPARIPPWKNAINASIIELLAWKQEDKASVQPNLMIKRRQETMNRT